MSSGAEVIVADQALLLDQDALNIGQLLEKTSKQVEASGPLFGADVDGHYAHCAGSVYNCGQLAGKARIRNCLAALHWGTEFDQAGSHLPGNAGVCDGCSDLILEAFGRREEGHHVVAHQPGSICHDGVARAVAGWLAEVRVELFDEAGLPVASALTDRFGLYRIDGLPIGRYTLRLSPESLPDPGVEPPSRAVEIRDDFLFGQDLVVPGSA